MKKKHNKKHPHYILFKNYIDAERDAIDKHIKAKLVAEDETTWTKLFAEDFKTDWDNSICKFCSRAECRYEIKPNCQRFIQDDNLMKLYKKLRQYHDKSNTKSQKQKRPPRETFSSHSRNVTQL